MEPVGLTFGVVALASLFSTCVDCFGYFKAAQSFEDDFEILLVKLDLEKERLLIWGNHAGILKVDNEGRAVELNESTKDRLVGRCLERIKALLSDTDKFQDAYGLRALPDAGVKLLKGTNFVSANSMSVFKSSYRRFWTRPFASSQVRPTTVMRTKWAIHDKVKFEGMINHLKDLIDGLNQVLPVKRETQDQIVREDISSILDLSRLKLVQSACEGSYRAWSEIASEVIEATETGTIDRRNIEEWMRDAEGLDDNELVRLDKAVEPGSEQRGTTKYSFSRLC
jgi:Prion-inhibition and propagation